MLGIFGRHSLLSWLGNGKETQSEHTFRKDVGCITGVASQTCPPVNAAATEMLVPLALLPYPGTMKRVVGIGMKRTRSVANGSGTTSTRDRWVCARWVGVRFGGMHRGFAVSLSGSLKGFQAPVTVNYFILVLLVVFHFLYLCFCSVLHVLGQSHNRKKCSLFMCWFLCSAKREEPVGFNAHGSCKNRFSHSVSLKYSYSRGELLALILVLCLLGPVLALTQCFITSALIFPGEGYKTCLLCF